jgi:pyruvate kinase
MDRIIVDAETLDDLYYKAGHNPTPNERTISDSIIMAACDLAQTVDARAILAMTHTGYSAYKLSSHRPRAGVYIFSNNQFLIAALSLVWGVQSVFFDDFSNTDFAMARMREYLQKKNLVDPGDYVINITSIPMGQPGKTNTLKLSMI